MLRTVSGLAVGSIGARALGLLERYQFAQIPEAKRVTRRNFTRNAALGAVGIVLAEIGVGMYYFVYPNKTGAFGQKLAVDKTQIPPPNGTPVSVTQGKFYIVHPTSPAKGLEALYWRCVHLGCTVPWKGAENHFHCPCHGSVYDYDGQRIAGPAPRSLDHFPITVQKDGSIIVDTGKVLQRSQVEANQITPYNV